MKRMAVICLTGLAALAGCSERRQYYVSPPPPPMYQQSLIRTAEQNGFADGQRAGQRDRYEGHSFRPRHGDRYDDAPGYYRELGGSGEQYRYYYRDGYLRGYQFGYTGR